MKTRLENQGWKPVSKNHGWKVKTQVLRLKTRVENQGWKVEDQGWKSGLKIRVVKAGLKAGLKTRDEKAGLKAGLKSRVEKQGWKTRCFFRSPALHWTLFFRELMVFYNKLSRDRDLKEIFVVACSYKSIHFKGHFALKVIPFFKVIPFLKSLRS